MKRRVIAFGVVAALLAGLLPTVFGVRFEFVLFALTLIGVALFHDRTLEVALVGVTVIVGYRLIATPIDLPAHLLHEAPLLLNLLGLLLGFALLAKHFEESKVPDALPAWLPDDWKGGFVLLVLVFVISSFLDNIAAAIVGGAMARVVFRGRVHIGFLAAIVAASNAGGAGSVVGDTTTTMMWIAGKPVLEIARAAVGSAAALLVFGTVAAMQQHRHEPITRDAPPDLKVDRMRLVIVVLILIGAIAANVLLELPAVGVWVALLIGAALRPTAWGELKPAFKGSVFLLALVLAASLMPVETLPAASWQVAFGLGAISAGFDNIPLTALAIKQGGYDWGCLAYAVGFGGSMMWFGSSAGVAIATQYPEARAVDSWLKHGWHVAVGYVVGFAVLLGVVGWNPSEKPASVTAPEPPTPSAVAPTSSQAAPR